MFLLAKYGTQTTFTFPMVKRGSVDLAVTGDWTPAAADSSISKDGGNYADTTNTVAIAGTSGTRGAVGWKITLTAAELTAGVIDLQIVDAATKAVEDQFIKIYTYGNASAKIPADLSDTVRLGLTALPNAAAEAAGGLYTRGTGAGQINQPANGMIDVNNVRLLGTAISTPATAGILDVNVKNMNNVAATAITTIKAVQGLTTADQVTTAVNLTTNNDKTGYSLTAGEHTNIATDTQTGLTAQGYTSTRAGYLDTLNGLVQAIWDKATSALTTVGSIGKLLVDNINATISSRLAFASYTAPDNTSISAIKAKTDNLPAAPAAVSDIPTASANAAAVGATVVEGTTTLIQSLRLANAANGGKTDGMATTTAHLRDLADTKNRVTATVDANGNRTAVTTDLT